jgi:hypothetical protein
VIRSRLANRREHHHEIWKEFGLNKEEKVVETSSRRLTQKKVLLKKKLMGRACVRYLILMDSNQFPVFRKLSAENRNKFQPSSHSIVWP